MLKQLTLKNFVLVESLDIAFNEGLTTITGESGAGKSILLNALSLLLGERARTEVIRPGADKADVSAEFDLRTLPHICAQLEADELSADEPSQCLVRRVVSSQGRSRAFINGIPVTTQYLRGLGEQLVEVYGQNEHRRLANRGTQLNLLDDYAGLAKIARTVAVAWQTLQKTLHDIEQLQATQIAAANRKDLLTYQLQELQELSLADGEFEKVETQHKRMSAAHATLQTLQNTLDALDEADTLRQASRGVDDIDDVHGDLQSAQANLRTVLSLIDDTQHDLRRYQDQIVVDPAHLAELEERLNTAQDLARKHRVSPQALSAHAESLREDLLSIDADSSTLEMLQTQAEKQAQQFNKKARGLSTKRKKAAPQFAEVVTHYMQLLGISSGAFDIQFEPAQSESGLERVEFHVTTNPNFPSGPLTQIASGGEQTRISLSIQIVAAQHSALPCLILDEADVGVGGTTADTVGRLLRDLGVHTQVICITHAPQVAALGNNHYQVVKTGNNTDIHELDNTRRIDELARMLAGADITDKTREYAESLLQAAQESRQPH
ncbi:MAG: DNA repair protein RecN [Gammaproteobacteria bacterium]|nr:DNA repair protein RecN [Gammaproteobacteria bacterium]